MVQSADPGGGKRGEEAGSGGEVTPAALVAAPAPPLDPLLCNST